MCPSHRTVQTLWQYQRFYECVNKFWVLLTVQCVGSCHCRPCAAASIPPHPSGGYLLHGALAASHTPGFRTEQPHEWQPCLRKHGWKEGISTVEKKKTFPSWMRWQRLNVGSHQRGRWCRGWPSQLGWKVRSSPALLGARSPGREYHWGSARCGSTLTFCSWLPHHSPGGKPWVPLFERQGTDSTSFWSKLKISGSS